MVAVTASVNAGGHPPHHHHPHPQHHISLHHQQHLHLQQLHHNQLLKQQQALIQQSILQHQSSLYYPAQIVFPSQLEPVQNRVLPSSYGSASCSSVYVGNIHQRVSVKLLAEVFATMGPLCGCKLIKRKKSSYGFVDYLNQHAAAAAILTLNGKEMFNQPIKVNWAHTSEQMEDAKGCYHQIFVGNLSPEITDAVLFSIFKIYPSCFQAHVMWDPQTGRSKGFGFVSFGKKQDAEDAINEMTGKHLGGRIIRCDWANNSRVVSRQDHIGAADISHSDQCY